jgi:hypothetical protein
MFTTIKIETFISQRSTEVRQKLTEISFFVGFGLTFVGPDGNYCLFQADGNYCLFQADGSYSGNGNFRRQQS